MTYGIDAAKMVEVDRVFLDNDNPRHDPYDTQEEVIEYLCRDEYVYELAKDIAKHGLSPIELFALVLADPKAKNGSINYVVAEGNRRICALKLLNDPDLAPTNKRTRFMRLAHNWKPIPEIFSVIFHDIDKLNLWIDRLHIGLQGGIGRKTWNTEQITRRSGNNKNVLAQAVLDYAENSGFISTEDRKGKITTVQRFLGNSKLRLTMGIDSSNLEDVCRVREKEDFDLLLKQFIADLLEKEKVNSRCRSDKIIEYALELAALEGLTGDRVDPESLNNDTEEDGDNKPAKPKKPKKPQNIPYDIDINNALSLIPSYKLAHLYYSICHIKLSSHTPLLTVGMWVFLETLTACNGRNDKTDFHSFLSAARLNSMGLGANTDTKSLRQVIKRISDYGNTTKHHKNSAAFNGEQLANDVETMGPMLLQLAKDAKT